MPEFFAVMERIGVRMGADLAKHQPMSAERRANMEAGYLTSILAQLLTGEMTIEGAHRWFEEAQS